MASGTATAPPTVRLDPDEHRAGAGRPRDPKVDGAVLQATRELLVTLGYRRLALDAVARRAGVSRTTLRLRWKSKAELVFDAVSPDPEVLRVPNTGSLETDIRGCVDNTVTLFRSAPMRAAFQGLVDDVRNYPAVRVALAEQIYLPSIEAFSGLVSRAVARGEIQRPVDPGVLFDVIAGSLLYRLTVSGEDPARLADQLVGILTAGLRCPDPAGTAGTAGTSATRQAGAHPVRPRSTTTQKGR